MNDWPEWVQLLPAIDTPFPGGYGRLLASEHGQVVLWSFPAGATVPRHQHGPQIGVVITGHVALTAGDSTRTVRAGESFSLADQVPHAATVAPGTLVIEIYADPDRHTPTEPTT
ncbi:cupin domain-containing protein [Nocardia abscessus]|uniref:cupin domain-containing protein n=1 Tax=Nocardia abscessus TaxID=120957 RepID=UPI0005BCFA25|nr:cupin domain-containing protein [Nocardia abscessus]MCC3328284.1 cupin domain-containing protein [Nocardia abscessus]